MFVGDSPRADIYGASRIGMVTVLKDPYGRYSGALRCNPDHRIRRILELEEVLEEYDIPETS